MLKFNQETLHGKTVVLYGLHAFKQSNTKRAKINRNDWYNALIVPPTPQISNNPLWEQRAQAMISHIKSIMPDGLIIDAEHIGSTSIPGATARDCIAINFAVTDVVKAIEAARNTKCLSDWDLKMMKRHVFSLGKRTTDGQEYQIYFITKLQRQWYMKKDFRDYMRAHPDEAAEYAQLKQSLFKKYPRNFQLYRKNKTAFVLSILRKCGYTMLEELDEPDVDTETWVKGNPTPKIFYPAIMGKEPFNSFALLFDQEKMNISLSLKTNDQKFLMLGCFNISFWADRRFLMPIKYGYCGV